MVFGVAPWHSFGWWSLHYAWKWRLALNKKAKVIDMGSWNGLIWCWDIKFRRSLFDWESELFRALLARLEGVRLCKELQDKYIWKFTPSVRDIFSSWIIPHKNGAYKTIWDTLFYAIVWSIWLARNQLVFKGIRLHWSEVARLSIVRTAHCVKALRSELGFSIDDFLRAIDGVRSFRIRNPKVRQLKVWQPPPTGSLKFNVDGSARGKPGPGGSGGVLRDESGVVLCFFSCPAGVIDSNLAELLAVREALRIFCSSSWVGIKNLIIESDSALIVSWINGVLRIWKYSFILNEIFSLIENLY
ncbi:hypothetical protein L1049_015915 [Liquidambar formosana]|uniref:RNase H type-1 domain-containing protein n=1 Tax=Liquidambar formosana TaxID=63359 RepID=A0AAP0S4V2_LIQFO